MILQIARKDWKLLWPLVLLVAAIQGALEWAVFRTGLFAEDPAAAALLRPLTMAWYVGIAALCAAIVHQDPIPGVDQDWLVRPIRRGQLLLAKLGFAATVVCVPMLVVNLADALAMGFPFGASLTAALGKELFVLACLVIPVMAIAALTRSMAELVILGAALMVTFSVCVSASALLAGAGWCPTCNSGVAWIQHALQHAGVLLGSAALLGVQYYRRRTTLARALCLAGTALFVFLQLPWSWAFALEQRASVGGAASRNVQLQLAGKTDENRDAAAAGGAARPPHGIDQTVQYLRRRARLQDAPVSLEIPLRIAGAADDELLLADRTALRLVDARGRVVSGADSAGVLASLLTPYPGAAGQGSGVAVQMLDVPGGTLRRAANAQSVRLDYSLTLMKVISTQRLAASHGELDAPEAGHCAVTNDRKWLYLRCKIIGAVPFCISAMLKATSGEHNAEVLRCTPDYRRHVPSFTDVLGFYGVDLPLEERNGGTYPIDASQLGAAEVIFKFYAERAHFTRSLEAPAGVLSTWRAAE